MSPSALLIQRGKLAAKRKAASRHGPDATLESALATFEALPTAQQVETDPAYVALANEIVRADAELDARATPIRDAIISLVMVSLSIAVMLCVAQLSMFYEEGQQLLDDLKAFQSGRVERRISQLERQLIYASPDGAAEVQVAAKPDQPPGAETGVSNAPGPLPGNGSLTTVNDLAFDRYYDLFFDLKDADRSVSQLIVRSSKFLQEAYRPVPLFRFVIDPLTEWYHGDTILSEYERAKNKGVEASGPAPVPCSEYAQLLKEPRMKAGTMWAHLISGAQDSCMFSIDNKIANYALVLPSMQEHINLVEARLKPYSVWIMPLAFAVFGALMYYMRLILNDALPNPSFSRVVHRVALAGVAAVVLSLFWSSLFNRGGTFEAAGFSVFTIAFLIGVSIDLFFSYIDRTLAVALGAMSEAEKTSEKGMDVAHAARG